MKKITLFISGLLLMVAVATPTKAETVMAKVARTGVLNAGTRVDAIPFAYIDKDGTWKGYSIEMLNLIKSRLEQQLGRKVELKLARITVGDRVSRVLRGDLDIACGTTSLNSRDTFQIDFSVGYFPTGTQFLIKKNRTPVSTGRWLIGVIPNTSNQLFIRERFPIATTISVPNRLAGIAALDSGRIDAFASDGILLAGLIKTQPHPEEFELVPSLPLTTEEYACILPKEDAQFRELVNNSLIGFMQGVLDNGEQLAIFDHWFGPTGYAPINRKPVFDYFQRIINMYRK